MTYLVPIFAFLVICALILRRSRGFEYDDSYIWFRYILNLAQGHGAVYNVGGDHYEGFSSPGWLVLAGGVRALIPVDTRALVKVLGGLMYAAAVTLAIYSVARAVASRHRPRWTAVVPAMVVGVLAVLIPSGPLWSVSGMESGFYAFSLVAFVLLAQQPGRPALTSLVFAFVFLARFEALILLPLPIVVDAFMLTRSLPFSRGGFAEFGHAVRTRARRWLEYAAGAVGAVGIITLARYLYFDDIMPGTVRFKAPTSFASNVSAGYDYLKEFALEFPTLGILLAGCLVFVLGSRQYRLAVASAFVVIAQAILILWVGGDWMGWYRFIAPFVPLLGIVVALAVAQAIERRQVEAGFLVIAALLIAATISPALTSYRSAWGSEGNGITLRQVNAAVGTSLKRLTTAHDVVAVGDAGAIPWYSQRKIVDLHGLLDRHLAEYVGNFSTSPHSNVDVNYVLEQRPACIVLIVDQAHSEPRNRAVPLATKVGTYRLYDKILADPRFQRDFSYVEAHQLAGNYVYEIWCDHRKTSKFTP